MLIIKLLENLKDPKYQNSERVILTIILLAEGYENRKENLITWIHSCFP